MDNHLNARTREVVHTLESAREKMDAILAREKKKDREFAELQSKCEEAIKDFERNPLVKDLRADIRDLEKELKEAQTECKKL